MNETVMSAFELIGTVAFSISGALVAISAGLDLFGILFIGTVTAIGGGAMRDIFLGNTPPALFSNYTVVVLSLLSALGVFLVAKAKPEHFSEFKEKIERVNNFFDALGLSAFTVTGSSIALFSAQSPNLLIVVFSGMITGIGGGMIRDVLVSKTPFVLRKHIYALASILGSICYFIIRKSTDNDVIPALFSMFLIFSIRVIATRYRLELPKINTQK